MSDKEYAICVARACFDFETVNGEERCIDQRYLRIPYLYVCDNNEYNHYTKKVIDCEIRQLKPCCKNTPGQADCCNIFKIKDHENKERNILVILEVMGKLDDQDLQKDCSCSFIDNQNYERKRIIILTYPHLVPFSLYIDKFTKYNCKLDTINIDDLCCSKCPEGILDKIQKEKGDCIIFILNIE